VTGPRRPICTFSGLPPRATHAYAPSMKITDEQFEYTKPQITDHGDLVEMTASTGTYGNFDATFAANTPIPPAYGSSTTP
jgi:hypothetical protein